jgi:hypothetical protein
MHKADDQGDLVGSPRIGGRLPSIWPVNRIAMQCTCRVMTAHDPRRSGNNFGDLNIIIVGALLGHESPACDLTVLRSPRSVHSKATNVLSSHDSIRIRIHQTGSHNIRNRKPRTWPSEAARSVTHFHCDHHRTHRTRAIIMNCFPKLSPKAETICRYVPCCDGYLRSQCESCHSLTASAFLHIRYTNISWTAFGMTCLSWVFVVASTGTCSFAVHSVDFSGFGGIEYDYGLFCSRINGSKVRAYKHSVRCVRASAARFAPPLWYTRRGRS